YQSKTVSSGATYTASIFAKAGTAGWASILVGDGGSNAARMNFNLLTGVLGSSEAFGSGWSYVSGTAKIEPYDDGWSRISAAFVTRGTTAIVSFGTANADISASSTAGEYNWQWGAQFEEGCVPTSYIQTADSTVTRAADNISLATSKFPEAGVGSTPVS